MQSKQVKPNDVSLHLLIELLRAIQMSWCWKTLAKRAMETAGLDDFLAAILAPESLQENFFSRVSQVAM